MDKRMCWLALCWLLGGCLDNKDDKSIADGHLWLRPHSYVTRWDKVNVDEILASKRLLQHYFNCLVSKGPCPPDGRELRRALPEALEDACAKCTKSQREGAIKVIRYLREFEPEKFEILASKYDPHGVYRKKYLEPPPEETNSLSDHPSDNRLKDLVKRQSRRP
ncbi:PREDICTED: ejaculatory bulb-specific protein 3-like [Ceratosolen solmsi marchali]|uniref:Ejaculatory bulb-specific protein 3-like n=1 Tax=Ceratosolen solmsi marchali TaxID=326594 RepID=A0AAJ6YQV9_9HYME|nr:PREDICTED: ejaculatory bulb-specific protein 3-like [Ceratosolen solmsi marchali]